MDPINNIETQATQAVLEPAEPKSPCPSSEEDEAEDHLAFVNCIRSGDLAKESNIKVKVRLYICIIHILTFFSFTG